MDRKQQERDILTLVYGVGKYAEILESEQPDFLIRHTGFDGYFGVEITEFYLSESNARLRNLDDYFNEIVFKNRYRHRTDKRTLKADEITILSPDGQVKETTRGIMQQVPTIAEYSSMVADIIARKDQKYADYSKALGHVNLIVHDTERLLVTLPVEHFYQHFFTESLRSALFASQFREIFFVTTLAKDRHVFIPLKMLLLLAELHHFGQLIQDYPWETSSVYSPDGESDETVQGEQIYMTTFARYLRGKTDDVHTRKSGDLTEVIMGGCGIVLEDGAISIRDHSDYPLPPDREPVNTDELVTFFSSSEFIHNSTQILGEYVFSTELAFDVKHKK